MVRKQKRSRTQKRALVARLLTIAIIFALLVCNIGLYALVLETNGYIDLTDEGLYTLSEQFMEEVGDIEQEITITFCTDPDYLLSNHDLRYVYVMAKEIEKQMDNVEVKTVNITKNPTAVQKYRTTSASKIKPDDVIVSCGERFRIINGSSFWSYDSTGEKHWAFNGEYKMANAFLSLSAHDNPTAYFTVGHGEKVYDANNPESAESKEANEFYNLLISAGLTVKTVNLDNEEIPEDCTLLIMNGPTLDYAAKDEFDRESYFYVNYTSPIEKIDRYMDETGSVMIFKDPFVSLPTLEEYLYEWGMRAESLQVKDRQGESSERELLSAVYANSEKHPLGYSLYSDVIDLASPPKTVVKNAGYVEGLWENSEKFYTPSVSAMYSPVLLSSEKAGAYDAEGRISDLRGSYHLAAISAKVRQISVSTYYSYMFYGASTALTSSEYLSNGTYGNYDIMFSFVRTMSRTDVYAADSLGALSMNTQNYGGKILNSDAMSQQVREIYKNQKLIKTYAAMTQRDATVFTLLAFIVPVIVLPIVCIYLVARRKYM